MLVTDNVSVCESVLAVIATDGSLFVATRKSMHTLQVPRIRVVQH